MTPEQAAWVREHVWTAPMRKRFDFIPANQNRCLCQYGRSHQCGVGREHEQCPADDRHWHGLIRLPGDRVARFAEPYAHPTDSDEGPQYERAALVWHADRICRWVCPCDCGHPEPAPPEPVQLDLFEEVA